ncbi:hypothetical protein HNY73_001609 [Argiope bruennichi]|uniref:Uncharacterized protein n=1 Tax=Argiope bruennichi TaxID=94029 RepID=A0A8T0FR21_ARGBR|nr:hypothetical protein HNY73_001609 [Argiope bruennichi]
MEIIYTKAPERQPLNIHKHAWHITDNACGDHYSCKKVHFTVDGVLVHMVFHSPTTKRKAWVLYQVNSYLSISVDPLSSECSVQVLGSDQFFHFVHRAMPHSRNKRSIPHMKKLKSDPLVSALFFVAQLSNPAKNRLALLQLPERSGFGLCGRQWRHSRLQ